MCVTWIRLCIPLSYPHTGIYFPYKFSIDFVEIGIHYKKTNAGFYRIFVQITFIQLTFDFKNNSLGLAWCSPFNFWLMAVFYHCVDLGSLEIQIPS